MVHFYKIQTLEFGKSWVAIVWRKEGEEGEKKRKQTRRGDMVRGSRSKDNGRERERKREDEDQRDEKSKIMSEMRY